MREEGDLPASACLRLILFIREEKEEEEEESDDFDLIIFHALCIFSERPVEVENERKRERGCKKKKTLLRIPKEIR